MIGELRIHAAENRVALLFEKFQEWTQLALQKSFR
jgi:hypothetical protein